MSIVGASWVMRMRLIRLIPVGSARTGSCEYGATLKVVFLMLWYKVTEVCFGMCYKILELSYIIHTFRSPVRLMDSLKPHKPTPGGHLAIFLVNMDPHADMRTMVTTATAMMAVISRMNPDAYADPDLGWSCLRNARRG